MTGWECVSTALSASSIASTFMSNSQLFSFSVSPSALSKLPALMNATTSADGSVEAAGAGGGRRLLLEHRARPRQCGVSVWARMRTSKPAPMLRTMPAVASFKASAES